MRSAASIRRDAVSVTESVRSVLRASSSRARFNRQKPQPLGLAERTAGDVLADGGVMREPRDRAGVRAATGVLGEDRKRNALRKGKLVAGDAFDSAYVIGHAEPFPGFAAAA